MSAHDHPAKDGPGGTPDWADFDADLLDKPGLAGGRASRYEALDAPALAGGRASRQAPPTPAARSATERVDLGSESEGDLDLGATFAGDSFSRPLGVAHTRRAHGLSAAGAGLAVVLALAIHAATEGVSDRRAPAGAATFAHLARTPKSHHPSRTARFTARAGGPRRRATSTAQPAAARTSGHAASTARVVIASSPRVSHAAGPAAEFGFER